MRPTRTEPGSEAGGPFGAFAPTPGQRLILAMAHGTALKRGAFRPMLSTLLERLRPGPIDTTFQGGSFRFHHRDSATERGALLNPGYDATELDFLRAHLPIGSTAADIGANVGIYTIALARHVGPTGRVLAVEPHPLAQRRLAFNLAASRLDNVVRIEAAAGDTDGTVAIEAANANLGAIHVVDPGQGARVDVPCRTLESLLAEAGLARLDALKIDVEGFEDRVLCPFFRQAPPALWPGAVVIEHLSGPEWSEDAIGAMIKRGYRLEARTRSNTMLRRGP